jgi:hypothetical protein
MDKDKAKELQHKIIKGLASSYQQLLEEKKRNNGKLALFIEGKVQVLNARDIVSPK